MTDFSVNRFLQKKMLHTFYVTFHTQCHLLKLFIVRLCTWRNGFAGWNILWKDVKGALLTEVKSSAYEDLGAKPLLSVLVVVSD